MVDRTMVWLRTGLVFYGKVVIDTWRNLAKLKSIVGVFFCHQGIKTRRNLVAEANFLRPSASVERAK